MAEELITLALHESRGREEKMASHPPGLPGLPVLAGLPGPSNTLGHPVATPPHVDRRRPEADCKPLSLNIPGFLHPPAGAAHLALPAPNPAAAAAGGGTSSGGSSGAGGTSGVLDLHRTGGGIIACSGGGEIRVDATRCPVCFRHFDDRWKLERHARVHTGERPFACSRCTKTFTRKEHLTRHELSHDGVSPSTPSASGGAASTAASNILAVYRSGAIVSNEGNSVRVNGCQCPVCFRTFGDRWKLERHARVHTGERPFSCGRCGNSFRRKEHLVRHELSHDASSNTHSASEASGSGVGSTSNALQVYRGGESRADACRCPVCFRHFGDRWKLERHARIHTGERPFSCGRCGKAFTTKEHLVRHEMSHDASSRANAASGASSSGRESTANAIQVYRGSESRANACQCPVCLRHFGDRWKLERHARIHTGERPFSCGRCGKAFTTKEHLVRHEMSHNGEKPYSCSVCGKAFTRKDHVDRHFKKTHSRPKYMDL